MKFFYQCIAAKTIIRTERTVNLTTAWLLWKTLMSTEKTAGFNLTIAWLLGRLLLINTISISRRANNLCAIKFLSIFRQNFCPMFTLNLFYLLKFYLWKFWRVVINVLCLGHSIKYCGINFIMCSWYL